MARSLLFPSSERSNLPSVFPFANYVGLILIDGPVGVTASSPDHANLQHN